MILLKPTVLCDDCGKLQFGVFYEKVFTAYWLVARTLLNIFCLVRRKRFALFIFLRIILFSRSSSFWQLKVFHFHWFYRHFKAGFKVVHENENRPHVDLGGLKHLTFSVKLRIP